MSAGVKTRLVVHHTPSRSTRELLEAVLAGTHDPDLEGVDGVVLAAVLPDMLNADGYLFGTVRHHRELQVYVGRP
jgi:hypothetical protein